MFLCSTRYWLNSLIFFTVLRYFTYGHISWIKMNITYVRPFSLPPYPPAPVCECDLAQPRASPMESCIFPIFRHTTIYFGTQHTHTYTTYFKSKGGSKVWGKTPESWNNHTTQRTQRTLILTLIKVTNFNVWLAPGVPTDQNRTQAWMGHRNSVSFFLPLRWTRRKSPPSIRSFESTTWYVDWMKQQLS